MGQLKLKKKSSEKDLGVIFDSSLRFGEHINSKVNKANRNVGLIFRTFTFMDKKVFESRSRGFIFGFTFIYIG